MKVRNRTRMKHEHGYRRHQQVHELDKLKRGAKQQLLKEISEEVVMYRESIGPHQEFNRRYAILAQTEEE